MTSSVTSRDPFQIPELIAYTMTTFMPIPDVYSAACVCKLWNACVEEKGFWMGLFECRGIPMVCDKTGPRDYRSDLRVLFPMTVVSGEVFRKILGQPEGKVPCLREAIFNQFFQPDLFEPEKKQKDTFQLIVEYPFVSRTLGIREFPFLLNAYGDLERVPDFAFEASEFNISVEVKRASEKPTRIPFNLINRIHLLNYPLIGRSAFVLVSNGDYIDLRKHSNCCPTQVKLYYQRRNIPQETTSKEYDEQQHFVGATGYGMPPFGVRFLSNAVEMITQETCPDRLAECFGITSTRLFATPTNPGKIPLLWEHENKLCISISALEREDRKIGAVVALPAEVDPEKEDKLINSNII